MKATTLSFGAMGSIDAVPLVIAQEKGYFEEEGLNVNLEIFTAAKDRDAALQAGELDGVLADEAAIQFIKIQIWICKLQEQQVDIGH